MIWRRDEETSDQAHVTHGGEDPRGDRMSQQQGQGTEVTVIGQGARLEGTIVSAGSLRIDGQVKGKIQADGDVMLSPTSSVEADITSTNVTVSGKFKGNITVKATAELARGGRVDGNITSKTLVISEGGVFCGQSLMDQGSAAAAAGSNPPGAAKPAGPPMPSGSSNGETEKIASPTA
jgi:cytoskeletal protein CcmA (bactofilin family)